MTRYYELNIDAARKAEADFVHRKRNGGLWMSLMLYCIGAFFIIIASLYREVLGGDIPFILLTLLVIGVLTFHSIITVQKHLDLVLSIEFQNALFSSAFKQGNLFSLIVSHDDQLFYADQGFGELFPALLKRKVQILDSIVGNSEYPAENLHRLNDTLLYHGTESFNVYIDINGQKVKARLKVSPISRPKGYFFVTGRLYHEDRTSQSHFVVPDSDNIPKQDQKKPKLLESYSEICAYAINQYGIITEVTDKFSEYMGYPVHEMENIMLSSLLHYHDSEFISTVGITSFEHKQIDFRNKSGDVRPSIVSQQAVSNGAFMIGIVAFNPVTS
jgi:hypothetical protein